MGEFRIDFLTTSPLDCDADTLITFRFEGEKPGSVLKAIDKGYSDLAKKLEKRGEISGKYGKVGQFYINGSRFLKVFIVGLGSRDELRFGSLKSILAETIRAAQASGGETVMIDADPVINDPEMALKMGSAIADVLTTAQYRFEKYLAKKSPEPVRNFHVCLKKKPGSSEFRTGLGVGELLGSAVNFSKDLCNEPSNILTPTRMAEIAMEMAAENPVLNTRILGPGEMKELGMNLLLAVSKGSVEEPRLIRIEYKGNPRSNEYIGLLGKGVTFDAGGINIKHGNEMLNMKRDMTGGAVVMGLMQVLAGLKPKINCVGVVPAAENMPQGNACKPGDVYRSMAGKWVEIVNTDAEGRLLMADAMTWMQQQYNLKTMIDIATLTTSARTAIGTNLMSVFSNSDELFSEMDWAGHLSGEEIWRMPLHQKYKKGVRSYFADMKNTSFTPPIAIKAALFLEDFLQPGLDWIHFDIATVDHSNKITGVHSRGATVAGLRCIANYLLKEGKIIKRRKK